MAKPELGTKRLCGSCGAKFYDLNKDPIICPKCNTAIALAAVTAPRTRPDAARAAAASSVEAVVPETQDAEFVSLEEADAETEGKKALETETADGGDDDIDIDESLDDDDAPFIEEQEEGDEDVTDIIGDVDNEEEA